MVYIAHVIWTRSFEFEDVGKQKNSVFDDSGLILAPIHLACSEVLNNSHVTHTPICTTQNEYVLFLGTIMAKISHFCDCVNHSYSISIHWSKI